MTHPSFHPFVSGEAKKKFQERLFKYEKNWSFPIINKMVPTSQGQTYVRIAGNPMAPPLVLLHGVNANGIIWQPIGIELAKEYRLYIVDNMYDFGFSVYHQPPESPDEFVLWLDELLTALDLNYNVNLAGVSHGSWIVSNYAMARPERIKKIVLLAAVGYAPPRFSLFFRALPMLLFPSRESIRKMTRYIFSDTLNSSMAKQLENDIDSFIENWVLAVKSFKPKTKEMTSTPVFSDSLLKNLKVPGLCLIGENEQFFSAKKAASRISRLAPSIMTEIIPGAGHDVMTVKKEYVVQRMLDFLGRYPDYNGKFSIPQGAVL